MKINKKICITAAKTIQYNTKFVKRHVAVASEASRGFRKQDFYSFKLCMKKGLWSRPLEVGTNIEVEALLVTDRRGLLA